MDYVLRNENGAVWAYRLKKGGVVSKAGHRVTEEEAARMVAEGEADWDAPVAPKPVRRESRGSYERRIQADADAGRQIQPRDWDAAMNRDD